MLAAGVGPVAVPNYLVILGVGEDGEVVMRKPLSERSSRNEAPLLWRRDDNTLFVKGVDGKALVACRAKTYKIDVSEVLPGTHTVWFHDEEWLVDGKPWSEWVDKVKCKSRSATVEVAKLWWGTDLYADIPASEQRKAVAACRAKTLAVTSALLPPGRHTAKFDKGAWCLDNKPWSKWVVEGRTVSVPTYEPPQWAKDTVTAAVLANDSALEDALEHRGNGVVEGAERRVKALFAAVPATVRLRVVTRIRDQYAEVGLPMPGLRGEDSGYGQPYDGDWDAYRCLALLSRLVPGALRPKQVPHFSVPDAILLRVLEGWLRDQHGAAAASPSNRWAGQAERRAAAARWGVMKPHQRRVVERFRTRDGSVGVAAGHFFVMDTGGGKTLTAAHYAFEWLAQHGSDVDAILLATPKNTVPSLLADLAQKRGADGTVLWKFPVFKVPRSGRVDESFVFKHGHINVIDHDHRRVVIRKGLAEAAPRLFVIFDEVDNMYAASQRTSAAREVALLCAKYVGMTATPVRKKAEMLVGWLGGCENFPVTVDNYLVAAARMVTMKVNLGIKTNEVVVWVPRPEEVRQECHALKDSDQWWFRMEAVVRDATDDALCAQAQRRGLADRGRWPKHGGVLLVADNATHRDTLVAKMKALGVKKTGGFEKLNDLAYVCVVVTKGQDRGYNGALRLGVMVTGVYASNTSSRHQLRGRIHRMGQVRGEVEFVTVAMKYTLLQLLHEKQIGRDDLNLSLRSLGEGFSADILRMLDPTHAGAVVSLAPESPSGEDTVERGESVLAGAVNPT